MQRMTEKTGTSTITLLGLQAALVALAWVWMFRLNAWVFAATSVNQYVAWIFLPAGLRILSVLVLRWPAVLGLFVGAFATANHQQAGDWPDQLVVAAISGLGPYVSVTLGQRLMGLQSALEQLQPRHLLLFSMLGAACNAIATNLEQYLARGQAHALDLAAIMFCGDMLGTVIVLYVAQLVLLAVDKMLAQRRR